VKFEFDFTFVIHKNKTIMDSKELKITVSTDIRASVQKVWKCWTDPRHIVQWNNASDDWHSPSAENELRPGGKFNIRMEAKDGSAGFDFEGIYDEVIENELIAYTMSDGRQVRILFQVNKEAVTVEETFDTDGVYPADVQRDGWQAILNNFKNHVETLNQMEKLTFEIKIDAPVSKVYQNMLDEKTYAEWTSIFNPSSHFKGSWEKGSKILFLGSDSDDNLGGMVSRIKENIPNEYVSIEHLGVVQNDKEIVSGPDVEGWAGSLENYTFAKQGNSTKLSVEMDSNLEFKSYFEETWPKALEKLKAICEKETN
jgi:uncharacterized protein YndB with AHSA1/START domain